MAIYGPNFNGTPIPAEYQRLFKPVIRLGPKVRAELQGVCDTETERNCMVVQANNGHRKIHPLFKHNKWGIYVYWPN